MVAKAYWQGSNVGQFQNEICVTAEWLLKPHFCPSLSSPMKFSSLVNCQTLKFHFRLPKPLETIFSCLEILPFWLGFSEILR